MPNNRADEFKCNTHTDEDEDKWVSLNEDGEETGAGNREATVHYEVPITHEAEDSSCGADEDTNPEPEFGLAVRELRRRWRCRRSERRGGNGMFSCRRRGKRSGWLRPATRQGHRGLDGDFGPRWNGCFSLGRGNSRLSWLGNIARLVQLGATRKLDGSRSFMEPSKRTAARRE